ncbi:MAG: hypothetical protein EKK40_13260 [Bradyrhizobiaceae bacterium]|nr:MAG: hypothetical protein EKK40_13260 [Bradyrhizobiaceae bacterium]
MKWAVTVVSPPNYIHSAVFREVAETIFYGLKALGYDAILTEEGSLPGRRHIVLGANLLVYYPLPLSDDAILYNLEQVENNQTWITPALIDLFKKHVLWDYCDANVKALSNLGIHAAHVLPIGYRKELSRIQKSSVKDIDVLFVGSMNDRRRAVLEAMHLLGLKVAHVFGQYGAQRDEIIGRSKLLLNLHFYDAKILEVVRISYYLANECAVLSERSANPEDDKIFEGGLFFSEYSDLAPRARYLCDNPHLLTATAERGFAIMQSRDIESYLRSAIASLNAQE